MLPFDIVVLGDGSLFDEGISNLLTLDAKLNVLRILYTDDGVLDYLAGFDRPEVVFVNEFDAHETDRIVRLIFSVPSVFVRCVIVTHVESDVFDIYYRSAAELPSGVYQHQPVFVRSKDELSYLARKICFYA